MIPDEEEPTNQENEASGEDITKDPFYAELINMRLLPPGELDVNRLAKQSISSQ